MQSFTKIEIMLMSQQKVVPKNIIIKQKFYHINLFTFTKHNTPFNDTNEGQKTPSASLQKLKFLKTRFWK